MPRKSILCHRSASYHAARIAYRLQQFVPLYFGIVREHDPRSGRSDIAYSPYFVPRPSIVRARLDGRRVLEVLHSGADTDDLEPLRRRIDE